MNTDFDKFSLIIDGKRTLIHSASLHYFRLPSQEMWKDRLFKIKHAGYNTVDIYFPWAYHSKASGEYDFTDIRDIRALLDYAFDLGLFVIARPGPYINAEYSGGGLPTWLFGRDDVILRNRTESGDYEYSPAYMSAVREWYSRIIPIINEYSNVVAFQVENEYSTNEAEPDYIAELNEMAREMGVKVPIFHNDTYCAGLYCDEVNIYALDTYPTMNFDGDWRENPYTFGVLDEIEENLSYCKENSPLFVAEMQSGWLDKWGGKGYDGIRSMLGKEHINIVSKTALSQGITMFNHYMGAGGTSWAETASSEVYTSYDFASPIRENGLLGENYYAAKALNYLLQSFNLAHTEKETQETGFVDEGLYSLVRKDFINNCKWWFVRNLSSEVATMSLSKDFVTELPPYEMLLLPISLQLMACKVEFSSFEIFARISNEENETVFLIARENAILKVKDSHGQTHEIHADNVLQKNFAKYTYTKGDKHTCLMFIDKETADKSWMYQNQLISGPDMLVYPVSGAFKESRNFIVTLPCGEQCGHYFKYYAKNKDIEVKETKMLGCSPEVDRNYDGEDWIPVTGSLDCITNRVFDEFIWYKGTFSGQVERISLNVKHLCNVYLNGHSLGCFDTYTKSYDDEEINSLVLDLPQKLVHKGKNTLVVLVQNLGFNKGYDRPADIPRGIISASAIPEACINWCIRGKLTPEIEEWPYRIPEEREVTVSENGFLKWYSYSFEYSSAQDKVRTMYANLENCEYNRAVLWLNGYKIGRLWKTMGPQTSFYLPEQLLKDKNTLSVMVIDSCSADYQKSHDYKSDRKNVNIKIELKSQFILENLLNFI